MKIILRVLVMAFLLGIVSMSIVCAEEDDLSYSPIRRDGESEECSTYHRES